MEETIMTVKIYLKNTIENEIIENVYSINYYSEDLFGKKIDKVIIKYIIPEKLMCGEIQEDEIDYKTYKLKDIDMIAIR